METKIKWNEGEGYITATYKGSGSGSASISSDVNEGIDREQSIKVETTDKSVSTILVVSQEGLREVFEPSDGGFVLADGGNFNVLKFSFPATLISTVNYAANSSNAAIVRYFLNKYPDITIGIGKYTVISEDVQVLGSTHSDGKVIGISLYPDNGSMLFYTDKSIEVFFAFRVFINQPGVQDGATYEVFYD